MTRTFLPRALRAGARLVADAHAHRLVREAGRWRVAVRHAPAAARPRHLDVVAREVWLAGGAVHTPALLQRSGRRGAVGRSLQLQTMARVVARFAEPVSDDPTAVAAHQVKEFAPRFTLGCSVSTPPHLAMAMLDHEGQVSPVREAWRHLAIFHVVVRAGRGRVVAMPGLAEPLVGYRLGPAGFTDLAAGVRALSRLLLHAGAETVYPGIPGARAIEDERDVERLPPTLAATGATLLSLHLVGSCRMGERAGACATDSFGRLRGADGLHVADASVLCDAPGVNPQGTIMAFARRNVLSALRKL